MNVTLVWVGLSVIASLSMSAMVLVSEYQKHETVARLFWLRVLSLFAVLPFAFVIEWPHDPVFYICVAILSALFCLSDALYYTASRDYGAGVTTRIGPLSVLLTFVVWTAVTPALFFEYLSKPLVALGIAACFVAAGYFALRLRHCAVSFLVLKKLLPVICIVVVAGILGKMAMDAGGNPLHAAVAYLVVQCAAIVLFYGITAIVAPRFTGPLKPDRHMILSAGLMALCSVVHIASKNIAYTFVPNPAYVTVIGLTAPLYVAVFYHFTGRADHTDKWAGFGIVISAAILVILTRF